MSMKYFVASRTIVSKMLGIPGYLCFRCLRAVVKTIKNTITSAVPRPKEMPNVRNIRIPEVK